MKYEIFGKNIEFNIENEEVKEVLQQELSLYKKTTSNPEVEINIVNKLTLPEHYLNNPKIHKTFENGFLASFSHSEIVYVKDDKLKVFVKIKKENRFKSNLKKIIHIGYQSNIENITAIIHELVLIPMNYFFETRALVHASSMKNLNSGKTIMFGGTGGVGKTSLELLLCKELGYSFISDDIAIIDKNGYVYPNLAYPKIYAYNVEGNKEMKKILFENRGIMDKLHWNMSKNLRGLTKARRAISPGKIYVSVEQLKNKIDEYYILSRNSIANDIKIEKISSEKASLMTLKIILNEYHSFNQHIIWHEYNSLLLDNEPILSTKDITKKWLGIYNEVFSRINCFNITIPVNISHNEFLSNFKEIFQIE